MYVRKIVYPLFILYAVDNNFDRFVARGTQQMDGWGGENLEISFRIWQCGTHFGVVSLYRSCSI
jgi:hypothetical protein